MTVREANTAAYRVLASGEAYAKYFNPNNCTSKYLGKGNTAIVLQRMKYWANRNQQQTYDLAQSVFANVPFTELPAAIYNWAYNHFQYKIDALDQFLKSPDCAWATRHQGMDCKSYSILVSTILSNLGIKHYFRRIKQANHHPNAYTHVYVVVPNDQKTGKLGKGYRVIDGMLHNNQEPAHIMKNDLYKEPHLPIYGLGNAATCSCNKPLATMANPDSVLIKPNFAPQNRDIIKGIANATNSLQEKFQKFEEWLTTLSAYAPAKSDSLNKFRNLVIQNLFDGNKPKIKVTTKGVYLGKDYINLSKTFANVRNNTPVGPALGIPTAVVSGMFNNINSAGQTAATTPAKPPLDISKITGLVSNLIGGNFIEGIVGPIFSEGFDCWGSSWSKKRAKEEFEKRKAEFDPKLMTALNATGQQLVNNANNFLQEFQRSFLSQVTYQASGAPKDCTKRGIDKYIEVMTELFKQYENAITQTLSGKNVVFEASTMDIVDNVGKYRGKTTIPQYIYLSEKPFNPNAVSLPNIPDTANFFPTGNVNPGGVPRVTNFPTNQTPTINQPQKAGFNPLLILVAIGGIAYGVKKFA